MRIVTIEFTELDAFRLLYLVQREAAHGRIWDEYWDGLAAHIRENIKGDLNVYGQIEYQEELARNGSTVTDPGKVTVEPLGPCEFCRQNSHGPKVT